MNVKISDLARLHVKTNAAKRLPVNPIADSDALPPFPL